MSTSTYSIFDFLKNCGGNWRNTLHVPCGVCIHPCRAKQRGALVTADGYGRPLAISVARYEAITGQRVDPDECVGTLQRYAFDTVFRNFSFWKCENVGECLLGCLDSEVTARPCITEPDEEEPQLQTPTTERTRWKWSIPPQKRTPRSKSETVDTES